MDLFILITTIVLGCWDLVGGWLFWVQRRQIVKLDQRIKALECQLRTMARKAELESDNNRSSDTLDGVYSTLELTEVDQIET